MSLNSAGNRYLTLGPAVALLATLVCLPSFAAEPSMKESMQSLSTLPFMSLGFVVDEDGEDITPGVGVAGMGTSYLPGTPLYHRMLTPESFMFLGEELFLADFPAPDGSNLIDHAIPLNGEYRLPILAPDGSHVTAAQWMSARGALTVTCTPVGTRTVIHLVGLIPHGVYTMWIFMYNEEGDRVAGGSLGLPDGSTSVVTVDGMGRGRIVATTPEGFLSAIQIEPVPSCLLGAQVQLVLAYHLDGLVYGTRPAPHGSLWAGQVLFLLP